MYTNQNVYKAICIYAWCVKVIQNDNFNVYTLINNFASTAQVRFSELKNNTLTFAINWTATIKSTLSWTKSTSEATPFQE